MGRLHAYGQWTEVRTGEAQRVRSESRHPAHRCATGAAHVRSAGDDLALSRAAVGTRGSGRLLFRAGDHQLDHARAAVLIAVLPARRIPATAASAARAGERGE